jgi:hypothetical protein
LEPTLEPELEAFAIPTLALPSAPPKLMRFQLSNPVTLV